jgi:hypothetical protein
MSYEIESGDVVILTDFAGPDEPVVEPRDEPYRLRCPACGNFDQNYFIVEKKAWFELGAGTPVEEYAGHTVVSPPAFTHDPAECVAPVVEEDGSRSPCRYRAPLGYFLRCHREKDLPAANFEFLASDVELTSLIYPAGSVSSTTTADVEIEESTPSGELVATP